MSVSPREESQFIAVLRGVRRALKGSAALTLVDDVPLAKESRTDGLSTAIGHTTVGDLRVEVWLDRYLDAHDVRRYSAWLFSESRTDIDRVAVASRWPQADTQTRKNHTNGRRETLAARPGASWVGRAFIDSWSRDGHYFGRYTRGRPDGVVESLTRDVRSLARLPVVARDPLAWAQTRRRLGQPEFRRKLMRHFENQCAVSGCAIEALLEAAHIEPYAKHLSYGVSNGLLLRADLHSLFDARLLKISERGRVTLAAAARSDPTYAALHGRQVTMLSAGQRLALRRRRVG